MKRRDGLAVADLPRTDRDGDGLRRHRKDLDPLVGFETWRPGFELRRDEHLHQLVGESRCRHERGERLDPARDVAGLLGEFASGRDHRRFARPNAAGAELDQPVVEGRAMVADEHQASVGKFRDHGDGTAVSDRDLLDGRPFTARPGDQIHIEGGASVERLDLPPLVHRGDDRRMDGGPHARRDPGAPPSGAIVDLRGVKKAFGTLQVLRGVDLAFMRGQTTVVLGPSGTGKSVMLKLIVGLLRPDAGEIRFEGQRVDTLGESSLGPIRRRIGYLFQQGALFDSLDVFGNVAFPLREAGIRNSDEIASRVDRSLRLVGLSDLGARMPSRLSGGQQKRIALARAIVLDPDVILYDEPTTGLDPIRADLINELIIRLQRTLDVTSIVVTHDLASAFRVADRMVMLHEGEVVLDAAPEEFRMSEHPVVAKFLRGEASEEELAQLDTGTTGNG